MPATPQRCAAPSPQLIDTASTNRPVTTAVTVNGSTLPAMGGWTTSVAPQ
ncbi:MAG: hypothetical protein QOC90_1225, partial [Mycobacterium sp.]|nr:hypothetical protein [Mycobacterium sp.]